MTTLTSLPEGVVERLAAMCLRLDGPGALLDLALTCRQCLALLTHPARLQRLGRGLLDLSPPGCETLEEVAFASAVRAALSSNDDDLRGESGESADARFLPSSRVVRIWFWGADVGLRESSHKRLARCARVLAAFPRASVRIEGHTGVYAPAALAPAFTYLRAQSVARVLAARGVHSSRCHLRGWGSAVASAARWPPGRASARGELFFVLNHKSFPSPPPYYETAAIPVRAAALAATHPSTTANTGRPAEGPTAPDLSSSARDDDADVRDDDDDDDGPVSVLSQPLAGSFELIEVFAEMRDAGDHTTRSAAATRPVAAT